MGTDHLEDIGIDGWIMDLRKTGWVYIGFIWLWIGTYNWLL
jgi:hypothetical protein